MSKKDDDWYMDKYRNTVVMQGWSSITLRDKIKSIEATIHTKKLELKVLKELAK